MQLPFYVVDAFTQQPFAGNPAAIVPLHDWLPDDVLSAIAREQNLSETAFIVQRAEAFHIRWFTPVKEVDLCGHATLAAAFAVCEHLQPGRSSVTFESLSGPLSVERSGASYVLDLPARPAARIDVPAAFKEAIGAQPEEMFRAQKMMAVLRDAESVKTLSPDFRYITSLDTLGLIVCAPSDEESFDFVSRFFAPAAGIDEDPVTGSAHCTLVPYWSERLGKKILHARQLSQRGGELRCEDRGERVLIGGNAVLTAAGTLYL